MTNNPNGGDRTPTPVVVPQNAFETDAGSRSISITQVHIPIAVLATVISAVLVLVSTVGFTWFRLTEHITSREQHIDLQEAISGGGFATKIELKDLQAGIEKRTRKMLKSMVITCRQQGAESGSFGCSVNLPEE